MEDGEFKLELLRRLDILIALQLTIGRQGNAPSVRERIFQMAELGMPPGEIGRFVGRKANYVSAVLGSRKARRKDPADV